VKLSAHRPLGRRNLAVRVEAKAADVWAQFVSREGDFIDGSLTHQENTPGASDHQGESIA
jgi:hypothetical protein